LPLSMRIRLTNQARFCRLIEYAFRKKQTISLQIRRILQI